MGKGLSESAVIVGCYVRVSTESQLENYSIDEQTERLKAYCKAKGWKIYRIYTDGGYSGGNTNRPALKQMLQAIHEKRINLVVVYKLDRLSRSQKDTLTLIEDEFLKNNVDFVSVNENFDTSTPFGRAMIGILSVFAQLEKDQITERFTMGRVARSKAGHFHGGAYIPTGYKYVNGDLEIDEIRAPQVKEVFERFLKGYSVNSIYRYTQSKFGWGKSHVHVLNILRNEVYIGKVKFAGVAYKGVHKPIVTEEVFYNVQRLLNSEEREQKKTSPQKTPFRAGYTLSGLIRCKKCGARYSAVHGFYRCYSRSKTSARFVVDPNCKNKNWKIDELDALVIKEIKALALSPQKIDNLWDGQTSTVETMDIDTVKTKIKNCDTQIMRLIDLYQVGNISIEQITEKIEVLEREKSNLQEYLNPQLQINKNSKNDFIERIKLAGTDLSQKTVEEKRMMLSSVIEFVNIDDEIVEITWRI